MNKLHTEPRKYRPREVRARINQLYEEWCISRGTARTWLRKHGWEVFKRDVPLARAVLRSGLRIGKPPHDAASGILREWLAAQEGQRRPDPDHGSFPTVCHAVEPRTSPTP